MRVLWKPALLYGVLLGGCTPLGFWIYEDPVVTVSRVSLNLAEPRPAGGSPLVVALSVANRNDYPLSTKRVELSLRLDGIQVGQLDQDSTVDVPTDTVSLVAMPLAMEAETTSEQLKALGSGTHKFAVRGRATFTTPIGQRKIRFAQEGPMTFEQRTSP
jgi:hypothetical protein